MGKQGFNYPDLHQLWEPRKWKGTWALGINIIWFSKAEAFHVVLFWQRKQTNKSWISQETTQRRHKIASRLLESNKNEKKRILSKLQTARAFMCSRNSCRCTCRHSPSYVLEGKCYFPFVTTGSVLSFMCRPEAVSLVRSQQPGSPSRATSMVKWLPGSSQEVPETRGSVSCKMGCGLALVLVWVKEILAAPGVGK